MDEEDGPEGGVEEAGRPEGSGKGEMCSLPDEEEATEEDIEEVDCLEGGEGREMGSSGGFGGPGDGSSCKL